MTETSTKKNLKKKEDEPNKAGYHFNYALLLAVVSLALIAIVFGILYYILFVEMKDLKAELNSKLSKNAFLSEKVKIESSQTEVLKLEKEFLLSKISRSSANFGRKKICQITPCYRSIFRAVIAFLPRRQCQFWAKKTQNPHGQFT